MAAGALVVIGTRLVWLALTLLVALVVFLLGGWPWLVSPAIWGIVLFVTVALVLLARVRHRVRGSVLLGLPIVVGGAAAIRAGAWDYVPWLLSPWLWLGTGVSLLAGAWLLRTHRARPREVVEGVVVGLVAFTLGWILLLAGIVFFVVVAPG